jgi:NAD(P)-dependent dehydrogenase (short-subunit alcohol dehydrogenase family)
MTMDASSSRDPGLAGRVAVVTGASGAIGGAVCRALAREGAAVVASARDPHALERVAATIRDGGGRAVAITADVIHPDALERLRPAAEQRLGPVTLVAAVAGGGVAVRLASNGDRTVAVWPAAVHAADHSPTTTGDRGYPARRSWEASHHATTPGGQPGTMRFRDCPWRQEMVR